ncbi:GrpB family protein [Sellimonas intestinalis]|uniref:GrpB family protein n=1 Tax=Sellimonas intestinalis TaxID=1653434 RepID=UPI00399A090C
MKKNIILKLLGNMCIAIEHVGSTSVKGMVAKPIIDIAVGVHDLNILKKKFLR